MSSLIKNVKEKIEDINFEIVAMADQNTFFEICEKN